MIDQTPGLQARPKAGAQRTLEGVAWTPWLGWECPVVCGWVPPSTATPFLFSLMHAPRHLPAPVHTPIGSPRPPETARSEGVVSRRAWAVFRLITNSNFVGCSTGRSAGFAPFQNLVHIGGGAPEQVAATRPIGHETTNLGKLPTPEHRRQPRLCFRKLHEPSFVGNEDDPRQQEEQRPRTTWWRVRKALANSPGASHYQSIRLHDSTPGPRAAPLANEKARIACESPDRLSGWHRARPP